MKFHQYATAMVVLLAMSGTAFSQVTQTSPGNLQQVPGGVFNPGQFPGMQGATPQQMQQAWMLRALQSRGGHHAPKTGYPQIIGPGPFANPQPMLMPPAQGANTSTRKSTSAERRALVKEQAENKKRLAKADAEQKKREKAAAANAKK